MRLVVDAYGASAEQRDRLFERIVEVAARETAQEAIDAHVTLESGRPQWGLAWRAAGWMFRHRSVLLRSLA